MKKKIIDLVVGTRPNLMKAAAIWQAFEASSKFQSLFELRLIHTGQHYSKNMSDSFFQHLGLPTPKINFGKVSSSEF